VGRRPGLCGGPLHQSHITLGTEHSHFVCERFARLQLYEFELHDRGLGQHGAGWGRDDLLGHPDPGTNGLPTGRIAYRVGYFSLSVGSSGAVNAQIRIHYFDEKVGENGYVYQVTADDGTISPGAWNHFAATLDNSDGSLVLYVNGQPVGSATGGEYNLENPGSGGKVANFGSDWDWTGGSFVLGGGLSAYKELPAGAVSGAFLGSVSAFRLHSSALAQADVARAMNTRLTAQEPGLLALWNLDSTNLIDSIADVSLSLGAGCMFVRAGVDYTPGDDGWMTGVVPTTAP
jgi:hypothetical protein